MSPRKAFELTLENRYLLRPLIKIAFVFTGFSAEYFSHSLINFRFILQSSRRSQNNSVSGYFLASREMHWLPVSRNMNFILFSYSTLIAFHFRLNGINLYCISFTLFGYYCYHIPMGVLLHFSVYTKHLANSR